MNVTSGFRSRAEVFDYLDSYAFQRKDDVDRRHLKFGLIKSYVLETSPGNQTPMDVPLLLQKRGWQIASIGDGDVYAIYDRLGEWGFVEPISARYLMLHTYRKTDETDQTVSKWVRDTAKLDSLWLAGNYFSVLWDTVVLPQMPDRFVSFKFEHLARFEDASGQVYDTAGQVEEKEDLESEDWNAEDITERRASSSTITEQARRVENFLPRLQSYHPAFKAIKMLRLPAAETKGGYEFWSWGKVTHRAPSFREGREQILSITNLYAETTRVIEELLWVHVEKVSLKEGEGTTIRGAPLTIKFGQPLSLDSFRNLIEITFERGQGPLRLWGNPIWLGERKVHVYGIDLHLWQRIYLELTPQRMVVILPKGTCGNTVHRLMTNIQRYVDPGAEMFVGDKAYSDLIRRTLLGRTDD